MRNALSIVGKVVFYFLVLSISFDLLRALYIKQRIIDAMYIGAKAAALQIDMNEEKIAEGIFDIDINLAGVVNKEYVIENLPASVSSTIEVVTNVSNTHVEIEYKPFIEKSYKIDNPTVFSRTVFTLNGLLIDKTFDYEIESGAVLMNKNDL